MLAATTKPVTPTRFPCRANGAASDSSHAMVQGDYCISGKCAGLCAQCLSDYDCSSQDFCIVGACAPKVGNGVPCLAVSRRTLSTSPWETLSLPCEQSP